MATDPVGLTCVELVELVTDYLEGALSPRERARFDAHLAECDGCQAYVEQMRTVIALTGRLTKEAIPPEGERALLDAFRQWRFE